MICMKFNEFAKIDVRVEPNIKQKLLIIADYNGRTLSRECRQVLKMYVSDFEEKHGEINVDC